MFLPYKLISLFFLFFSSLKFWMTLSLALGILIFSFLSTKCHFHSLSFSFSNISSFLGPTITEDSFPAPFLPPPGPLPSKPSVQFYPGGECSFLKLLQIVCLIVFGWGLVIFNKALNPSTSLKITRLLCGGQELKIAATLLGKFRGWVLFLAQVAVTLNLCSPDPVCH